MEERKALTKEKLLLRDSDLEEKLSTLIEKLQQAANNRRKLLRQWAIWITEKKDKLGIGDMELQSITEIARTGRMTIGISRGFVIHPVRPILHRDKELVADRTAPFMSGNYDADELFSDSAEVPIEQRLVCSICRGILDKRLLEKNPQAGTSRDRRSFRNCVKCSRCRNLICIACNSPWHTDLSCREYKSYGTRAKQITAKFKYITANLKAATS